MGIRYVTFLYKVWSEDGKFYSTNDCEAFYAKLRELEGKGLDYHYETERMLSNMQI